MLKSICTSSLLLLSTGLISTSSASQEAQVHLTAGAEQHQVDPAILAALEKYPDPVDAFIALHPEAAEQLAEPRLLRLFGESSAQWMTEGDKMRLKRQGKQFTDITGHEDFYKEQVNTLAGKARKFECLMMYMRRVDLAIANNITDLPKLSHHGLIKPLLPLISTDKMHDVLKHMTSYYTRYFNSVTGERSSQWLYDHIAEV